MDHRVLVVDDDEAVRLVIGDALRGDGYEVRCACDGEQALTRLRAGPLPALVLLDLMMPRVTGWQLLDEMRASPRLRGVPVVVLTAFDSGDDVLAGQHVLHKPIDAPVLLGLVRALLGRDHMLAVAATR